MDKPGVAYSARVHADLVRTAFEHAVKVVERVYAAADGQRNEYAACNLTQNVGEQSALLDRSRDVVKDQLVRSAF